VIARSPFAASNARRRTERAFWLVVFALAVSIMGNNAPSPIYPVFQARFGLSTGEVTLVFAAVVAGVIPSLLYLGPLSDRVGRQLLLAGAVLLGLLAAIGFTLASGLGGLLAARAVQGLAFGCLSGTAVAALLELEKRGDHARATLVATVTIVASQAIAPLAAGLLAQYAPDPAHLTFFVLAGLLAAGLIGIAWVPETVSRHHLTAGDGGPRLAVPASIRRSFLVAASAVTASFAALGLVAALGPKFVSSLLHVHNLAVGGAVVFAMLGTSALAQVTLRHWALRRQLMIGASCLTAGMLALLAGVTAESLAAFVAGTVTAGAGQGLSYLGAQALLEQGAPADQRGSVMSAFYLVLYLAAAASALAVGLTSDPLGLKTATSIVAGAIAAGAALSAVLTAREVKR